MITADYLRSATRWHLERIGIRELRQHASQYLARVAADREPIEITDRGRPIARLVPITNDDWANMITGLSAQLCQPRTVVPVLLAPLSRSRACALRSSQRGRAVP